MNKVWVLQDPDRRDWHPHNPAVGEPLLQPKHETKSKNRHLKIQRQA